MPSTRKIKKENNEVDDEEAENPETESKKQSFIVKDPTQWLFFTKDEVIKPDPNKNNETVVCGLRHPRTGQKCLFLFTNEDKDIYEIVQFKEEYRSWFIGETIQHDGSIFLTTQVDPVFLILPYLIKAAQSEKFMTLDQTVCDDDFPECQRLQSCCQPELLEHVADVKGDDDFKVYRFNKDKTLSWLKLKTENVCKVLERKNICVSGAKTSELIQSKATEDEYMRYAYGIVSDYLSTEMSSALREHLGIPVVTEKRPSDAKNPPSKRAKLEDITPSEDYSSNVKQDDKSNKYNGSASQLKRKPV
ncbi:ribonuclease H2 subunit B-like isoform X2 [Mercenaria mercenaria]|uniref:ribonuclease H2 subunit B-like isoform X2 n=1 Tax=Mercenaria mercenaria TaxID=6596 RepID=UPI001E1D4CCD|nr:ribonuclease H2 subunit B-like isoform X2 [Mercenaria mercenaria]